MTNNVKLLLLMPHFHYHKLKGNNLNHLLDIVAPDLVALINQFTPSTGCIINQVRQEISLKNGSGQKVDYFFIFTINKLDHNNLVYLFDDVTTSYNKEKEFNQILLDKAIEQGKFEIASDILHDIGNAVVGFGAYITKIKYSIEQNDLLTLENLKGFIDKNQTAFSEAIGEKKANAISDLLGGVITDQKNNIADIKTSLIDQTKIMAHVQEILNIQRQYVRGQSSNRLPVNLRTILNDSASMLLVSLERNGIAFHLDGPAMLPKLKGDRTKLMQVFLNLLKNAVESLMDKESGSKEIHVSVFLEYNKITVKIHDNGQGFDQDTGATLFTKGYTTKANGTGLGLATCKSIIEGHNGEMTLTSDGVGKGATVTVIFNL